MYLFSLCIFLHINFATLARMLQGSTPMSINMSKINALESPRILCSFTLLRLLFTMLVCYNSLVLSFLFYRVLLISYYVWFIGIVMWASPFTSCNFSFAFKIMVVMTLYCIGLCIEFPILAPNVIWCAYCLYLTSWYRWCLPL